MNKFQKILKKSRLNWKSYEERLQRTGLMSLEDRRRMIDLTEAYKFMGGGQYENFNFVRNRHRIHTRSSDNGNLVSEKCLLNVRKNFFYNRITKDWNELPREVRNSETIEDFKRNYISYANDKKWLHCTCIPNHYTFAYSIDHCYRAFMMMHCNVISNKRINIVWPTYYL